VKDTTPGMLRKRTDTYQFSHICGVGSMDPEAKRAGSDDPILIEWKQGDQREWVIPDPKKKGKFFQFTMGGEDVKHGLKWDKKAKRDDDTWDLQKVRESAFYVTEHGTKIRNNHRLNVVQSGRWMPTNHHAPPDKRSYRITAFHLPFKSGDFGQIAVAFLEAKRMGKQSLKVFVYEYLAEEWTDDVERTEDEQILKRYGGYKKGEKISQVQPYRDIYLKKDTAIFLTIDVQKFSLWAVAREWIDGGDSGLINYYNVEEWDKLEKIANDLKITQAFIDCGYAQRKGEVFDYCMAYGGYPTIGSEKLSMPYKKQIIDPYEGKHGQGKHNIAQYTFHTDIFKSLLQDMMMGKSEKAWWTYSYVENEYVRQVASEERVNGEWKRKRGHPDNHLWDCEVLQLLAATIGQLYYSSFLRKQL